MSAEDTKYYTSELPAGLYRAEQVRELDRFAINELGIAGFELMSRAGQATFSALLDFWPEAKSLCVFCGTGNNGGDGYVIAALAERAGLEAHIVQVGDVAKITGDAAIAMEQARLAGASFAKFDPTDPVRADVVVDALLGTGLSGPVRAPYREAIEHMNCSGCPLVAVDIPSGLNADTGSVLGVAVKADITVSFIGMKQGVLTGEAPAFAGQVLYADLAVPAEVFEHLEPSAYLAGVTQLRQWLPPRSQTAHKGQNGRVLVIGGDLGFGGAVIMAAEAAGRVGAGLITVLTRPDHVLPLLARRPECMAVGIAAEQDISAYLSIADVVVIGPGIGQEAWGLGLLEQVLATDKPVVLDADGLNYLAQLSVASSSTSVAEVKRGHWVLTPHPGEASRLLQQDVPQLMADRFASARELQQRYSAVAVLKGAGSLIATTDQKLWLSATGNPGMASGGMGDVLSGVIGGLVAQGLSLDQAAVLGVWIHGKAADRATLHAGQRGLLATDLMPHLRRLVNDYGLINGDE